jgi:hypothetical protein
VSGVYATKATVARNQSASVSLGTKVMTSGFRVVSSDTLSSAPKSSRKNDERG